MSKVWFITGASRGFGLTWTKAALERGDRVAATVRDRSSLDDLVTEHGDSVLPLVLDVRDRDAVFAAVDQAVKAFGRLDVVVNNAGYGHFGFAEEATEQEVRDQIDVNVLGLIWVTQAAIPVLRAQGSGHLLHISSVAGLAGAPSMSLYAASKFAVEGFGEAVAGELAGFGIKTTIVEPGGYATDWAGSSGVHSTHLPAYEGLREQMAQMSASVPAFPGPEATVESIFAVVDSSTPPLRLPLSTMAIEMAVNGAESRVAEFREVDRLARSAD